MSLRPLEAWYSRLCERLPANNVKPWGNKVGRTSYENHYTLVLVLCQAFLRRARGAVSEAPIFSAEACVFFSARMLPTLMPMVSRFVNGASSRSVEDDFSPLALLAFDKTFLVESV